MLFDDHRGLIVFHNAPKIENPPGALVCRNRRRSVAGVVNLNIQLKLWAINKFFSKNFISDSNILQKALFIS